MTNCLKNFLFIPLLQAHAICLWKGSAKLGKSFKLACGFQIYLALSTVACSHTVLLRSEPPGASIFIVDSSGKRGALAGTTPATLTPQSTQGYVSYEVQKNGYESTTVVVPLVEAGRINLGVTLKQINDAYFQERFQKVQTRVLSTQFFELLKLQNAILDRQHKEVERLTKIMQKDFDQVSAWHSMLGNYHLLQNNRKQAVVYYQKALELDPQNTEAEGMLKYLGQRGGN